MGSGKPHDERGAFGSDQRANLRIHLARVGIDIDEKPKVPVSFRGAADIKAQPEPIDRADVRRILAARGAPARDIEWLTSSCPSIAAAESFARYESY